MRVVTTCTKQALEDYGHRWLDSRKNWPKDTEFLFYTEGFEVDCPGKDFRDLPEFTEWKMRHARYRSPGWKWDVVAYAHKVFAAIDALKGYRGIGVWLDADCVTYKRIPKALIEKQVDGVYLACYQRTGFHTETGLWIMDCSHPMHEQFCDTWRNLYLSDRYRQLGHWTDCHTLDSAIRSTGVPVRSMSEDAHMSLHPMATTTFGKYIDHQKGYRKSLAQSPENKFRTAA